MRFRKSRLAPDRVLRSEQNPTTSGWVGVAAMDRTKRDIGALALVLTASTAVLWLIGGLYVGFGLLNPLGALLPDPAWSVLTSLGDSAVALALFLFFARGNLRFCAVILIASLLGLLWTHGFKQGLPLPRPSGLLPEGSFYAVGELTQNRSFPSGHAQTAMTLAAVAALCVQGRVWPRVFLALGLASAASRIFIGMHWPVDVLAGAAGGCVCVLIGVWLTDRMPNRAIRVCAWIVLPICVIAAVLVAAGHPASYPAAQPWMRAAGIGALAVFLLPMLRDRLARRI